MDTGVLERNNVSIRGKGEQTIMMAHGFGCDNNVWRHLVKEFESNYRIVLFDYVGAGQSDLTAYTSQKYSSLDGYAQDVIEILEALNLQDVIFFGHSVSSMIGVKVALMMPERLSKLFFIAPSPCYFNDQEYVGGMDKEDLDDLLSLMDNNYLGWSGTLAPLVMGNPERPELAEELTVNFCSTDPDIAKEFARVTFLSDSRSDLINLTIPSVTLQCSEDILAPLQVGEYIRQHTPLNSLVILKATGHCPHLSAPEETISVIKDYI